MLETAFAGAFSYVKAAIIGLTVRETGLKSSFYGPFFLNSGHGGSLLQKGCS